MTEVIRDIHNGAIGLSSAAIRSNAFVIFGAILYIGLKCISKDSIKSFAGAGLEPATLWL